MIKLSQCFKIFFFISFLNLPICLFAQQQVQFINYANNPFLYNPAAAGITDYRINASLLSKFQWIGIKGAPRNNTFWLDYKVGAKPLAFGLNVMQNEFGANRFTDVALSSAYYIQLSSKYRVITALRVGYASGLFDLNEIQNVVDRNDVVLREGNVRSDLLKIGWGAMLQSKSFYFGVASADFFTTDNSNTVSPDSISFFNKNRNYVVQFGKKISMNERYNLNFNGIFYSYSNSKRLDLSSTIEVKNYCWAGLSLSTNKQIGILAGAYLTPRLRFGYSFTVLVLDKEKVLNSHEVNLLIRLDNIFKKDSKKDE